MSILFESTLQQINSHSIIKIPPSASELLPSRGMVMIQGTVNQTPFITALEPDGNGSHWFEVSELLCADANLQLGNTFSFSMDVTNRWIEPEIPSDFLNALIQASLMDQWNSLTTKAHWEWIRFIRSTQNAKTRETRIQVSCSKLQNNKKRPCCFDTSRCTVTQVSKSEILLDK